MTDPVMLRDATDDDMELVLKWRNIPEVYRGFYQQSRENRVLTYEEHYKWWHSRYNWQTFIIMFEGKDAGCINIGQLDNWNPEVSIFIGEVTLWGKGIGKQALSLALDWLKSKGYEKVHTTILKNNARAIWLFESLGFQWVGEARKTEWAYELSWILG